MKPICTIILLSLLALTSAAQDYQCVLPADTTYFTNTLHYLRAMRIDSVRQAGNATVLYPFHTARGYYYNGAPNPGKGYLRPGGSWLGNTVAILPDGTHYFDNMWGDSVIIKTQAAAGDSWTMYDDTSTIYYRATVSAIDTMSFAGFTDSVKIVQVTAYNQQGILPIAPAHHLTFAISKQHGFAIAPDVFTFPYHKPGAGVYTTGEDYYLDKYGVSNGSILTFQQVRFENMTFDSAYNFQPGDVLLKEADDMALREYTLDTILSKTNSINTVQYTMKRWTKKQDLQHPQPFPSAVTSAVTSLAIPRGVIISDIRLPEEWGVLYAYYYDPADTAFCTTGRLYGMYPHFINFADSTVNTFEPCSGLPAYTYKEEVGDISFYYCLDATQGPGSSYYQNLVFANIGGKPCGIFEDILSVKMQGMQQAVINIYPCPASDLLTIETPDAYGPYSLYLYNAVGTAVAAINSIAGKATIDVSHLPGGMYLLHTKAKQGAIGHRKIMIQH